MILQPQKDFPIVRQIANHLDIATYYVQAVVRDADGSIIDTVRLTDQGEQRFQKRWRTPIDASGQGAYISIVTSVYTDSNYTTKSNNYGDEENTYLVADRLINRGGGGNSGPSLSDIRRIVADELDKREKEEVEVETPEPIEIPRYDAQFDKVIVELSKTQALIGRIPTEKIDFTHVLTGIQNLATAIDEKEVTPETNLEPALARIESVVESLDSGLESVLALQNENHELLVKEINSSVDQSMKKAKYVNEIVVQPHRQVEVEKAPQEKKKPFNIRKLVS